MQQQSHKHEKTIILHPEWANIKEALVTAAIPYLISQKKDVSNDVTHGYFLFPVPIVRRSKLRRVSSRLPLVATARVKEDDLDSNPGCDLWVENSRPLPDPNRLVRFSLASPLELGLLLDSTALFDVLPVQDNRPLSESVCWRTKQQGYIMTEFQHKDSWKQGQIAPLIPKLLLH